MDARAKELAGDTPSRIAGNNEGDIGDMSDCANDDYLSYVCARDICGDIDVDERMNALLVLY